MVFINFLVVLTIVFGFSITNNTMSEDWIFFRRLDISLGRYGLITKCNSNKIRLSFVCRSLYKYYNLSMLLNNFSSSSTAINLSNSNAICSCVRSAEAKSFGFRAEEPSSIPAAVHFCHFRRNSFYVSLQLTVITATQRSAHRSSSVRCSVFGEKLEFGGSSCSAFARGRHRSFIPKR